MDKYKQKIPPYKIHQPEILFDLSEYKKEGTPPELFMSLVGQIKEKYHNYLLGKGGYVFGSVG